MSKNITDKNARRKKYGETYLIFFILVVISFVFSLINGNFLSKYNFVSIAQALTPYAVMSVGVIFVIATGGTDLSVGATCIGAAVVAGSLYMDGMPLWMTIPVMIIFGAVIGLINGLIVSKLKIPPFITTLGTMMFVRGATALFAGSPNVFYPTGTWFNRLFSTYNDIPIGFIWIILFGVIAAIMLNKNKAGRYILAIGSNEEAARLSGIDVVKYKTLAYVIAGIFAGISGVFWSASFATISVATGNGMELDAIAGAYIGGTSASGGSANVLGAILGSLMLVVIRSGLNFTLAKLNLNINSSYMTFVLTGIIVVLAVMLDKAKEKYASRKKSESTPKGSKRRIIFIIISIILCVFMVTSNLLNFTKNAENENKTVALLMKSEDNGYWRSVAKGAQAAADERGYTLVKRGTESEDPSYMIKQRELLQTLMSQDPAGLGVACIADGFSDLIEAAYDRGIPVVQYDTGLWANDREVIEKSNKNPVKSEVETNVLADSAVCGEKFYPYIRLAAETADHYKIGIIQFEDNEIAARRTNGFIDGISKLLDENPKTAGKYEFIIEVKPSSTNNAYKDALEALCEKGVNALFMTNEVVVNQVSDAIASSGTKYDNIIFCGYDAGTKQIEWLKSGKIPKTVGAVSQDPYSLGYTTVKAIIDLVEGKEIDEHLTVDGVWYTEDNVDELLEKGAVYMG